MSAAVTAHAGLDLLIHAILDVPAIVGRRGPLAGATRQPGEAVCGEASQFGPPPDALWEPVITCAYCAVLIRADGIELVGCSR